MKYDLTHEQLTVLLSVIVQLPMAIFLGHYYDQRIFLDTGYLVSSGLNPYQQHEISVFSNPHLTGLNPIIGYPSPWPLLLGIIYRQTYSILPNLFIYNFATKIPIIASNILLAYVTKNIMLTQNLPKKTAQFTWLFLLFNPFTLLTTTAWGQFDTFIALLCVWGLYLLSKGKTVQSAFLLTVSFVFKPISLPLLGLPLLFASRNRRNNAFSLLIIVSVVLVLGILPFYVFGWVMPASSAEVSSFFKMAGGMTVFNVIDVLVRSAELPAALWFLGYLWVPALIAAYIWVYRNPPKTVIALAQCAVVLLLAFFLFRSWLSEQNINLLLPFLLILIGAGTLTKKMFHLAWLVPLVFLVLNASLPQLFFLVDPSVIAWKEAFDLDFGTARLAARFAVTLVWYIVALAIMKKTVSAANKPLNKAVVDAPSLTHQAQLDPYTVPLTDRLAVRLYKDCRPNCLETAPLQKGLVLMLDDKELVEEGVGFGVPVVKYMDKTFFSSKANVSIHKDRLGYTLIKVFTLDSVSVKKVGNTGYINHSLYSGLRKKFELMYLKHRKLKTAFNKIMEIRQLLKIKTEFKTVKPRGSVTLTYRICPEVIQIHADFSKIQRENCKELILLNEQGASFFQKYTDSKGETLLENRIGAWDKVTADHATLHGVNGQIQFSLRNIEGAALFRGYEWTRKRFCWVGLSYSVVPNRTTTFDYVININRLS
ncbi:MAG: hypothetical protein M1540_01210 [Candidatus Bathyarchaeota archaeon]|nr:hypothetical protein [Candidatus Bathyarchaeota archaeon]